MSDDSWGRRPVSLEDVGRWLAEHHMPLTSRQLRLAHLIGSRLIGEGSRDRANLHNLSTPLAALATRPLTINGAAKPAPLPHLAATGWPFSEVVKGWPQGGTALNRLGKLPVEELDRMWASEVDANDLHATLPIDVVLAFLPPPMWAMITQVIKWKPDGTQERLRRFLKAETHREVPTSEARPDGGPVGQATIRQRQAAMRRLMKVLVRLNNSGWQYWGEPTACEELRAWTSMPDPINLAELGAREARTDRGAPPLRLVRITLAGMVQELEARRRTRIGRQGMLGLYRDTLLLTLLIVLGCRVNEVRRIRPRDIDPGDDHHGPRILLHLSKKTKRETSWKPIPREVAALLQGWLEYTGLDQPQHRDRVIWFGRWAHEREVGQPGAESSVETLKQAAKRLIPKSNGRGSYSGHTLRHLAEQLAKRVGQEWLSEHPEYAGRVSDQVIADALLDHEWGARDKYGYSDLEGLREQLSGVASHGVWELVATDRGARTAPDWDHVAAAQHRRDELISLADHWRRRVADLKAERRRLITANGAAGGSDAVDDTTAARRRYEDERDRLNAEVDDANDQLDDANTQLHYAEDELRTARALRIPVLDEFTDREYELLLEGPLALEPAPQREAELAPGPIRDWLTPAEVAIVWGRSKQLVRNWFNGKARGPFDISAVDRISERKQRLLVDKLDRTRIPPEVMERINYFLTQPPLGLS